MFLCTNTVFSLCSYAFWCWCFYRCEEMREGEKERKNKKNLHLCVFYFIFIYIFSFQFAFGLFLFLYFISFSSSFSFCSLFIILLKNYCRWLFWWVLCCLVLLVLLWSFVTMLKTSRNFLFLGPDSIFVLRIKRSFIVVVFIVCAPLFFSLFSLSFGWNFILEKQIHLRPIRVCVRVSVELVNCCVQSACIISPMLFVAISSECRIYSMWMCVFVYFVCSHSHLSCIRFTYLLSIVVIV